MVVVLDPATATHRLLLRGADDERIAALNRVVAATLDGGDEAYLSFRTEDLVDDVSPHTRAICDERLSAVPDDERVAAGACVEYRADLPADADALREALTVYESETPGDWGAAGEHHWRVMEVYALVVRRDGEWSYYSIPHHEYYYLDADVDPTLPDRASDAIADLPSVVVSERPLVAWGEDDRYRLTGYQLRAGERSIRFGDLRRVVVDERRCELVVDWETTSERLRRHRNRAVRAAGYVAGWAGSLFGDSGGPPQRIPVDDRETLADVVEALETARGGDRVDFEIVRS